MPATPRRCQFHRQGVCQGWRGPSLHRPPVDRGRPGSECTLDCSPFPLPIRGFRCLVAPSPLFPLRWSPLVEGVRVCLRPFCSLSPILLYTSNSSLLCAPKPTISLTRTCLLYVSYLRHPLLVPSGLGQNVGTLPQTSAGHAGVSGLEALASHRNARRSRPTFTAGVDGRTSRSCWCSSVSRQRRPLLLHHPPPPQS